MEMKDVKEIIIPDPRYEVLEYIHFDGNDLINTGYTPYTGMTFELDCQWDSDGTANRYNGHGRVVSNNRAFIGLDASSKITYGIGAVSASYTNVDPFTRHKYTIKCSSGSTGSFSIDDTVVVNNIAANYVNSDRGTMYIGGVYRNSTDYGYCYEKVYEARFYNAGTLVWILKPGKRVSDGKVGLIRYRVNGAYTTNAVEFLTSTNDLVEAGPVVSISEIGVNKIVNSSNQIIWGSQAAFPYRRLEYIHFSGAERVQTTFYAGTNNVNYQTEFTIDEMPIGTNSPVYIGINDQTLNNNLARLYLPQVNSTGIHINIGNTWSDYASSTPINTKLKFSASLSKTSNGNPRIYFYLYDQITGQSILSIAPLQASAVGDLNTNRVLSIGAGRYITSSSDTYVNFWKGNCYNFQQRSGGASGDLLINLIPCQRKSDNRCGLYDTINNVFYPMQGTTITSAAAGPVIDEYWDLTA